LAAVMLSILNQAPSEAATMKGSQNSAASDSAIR
jgi:hypothetical protein